MMSKFCRFCNCEHPLTREFWSRLHYSPKCKVRVLAKHAEWKQRNPEKYREYAARFYKNHKQQVIQRNNEYATKRKHVDVNYKLTCTLRGRITKALTVGWKSGSAVRDLGCSIADLRSHLESKFIGGMSWENYGRSGWHIDHIRPLSSFDLTNPEEFKQAVHYTNLQPLWASDNCQKSNKWSA